MTEMCSQKTIYDRVMELGLPPDSLVVIGNSALEIALGTEAGQPTETSLVVAPRLFRQVRAAQPDWQEVTSAEGEMHLQGDGYDISTSWGGRDVRELAERGYRRDGIPVAGLPDIYNYKQAEDGPGDSEDISRIRERLWSGKPLPRHMLHAEIEAVQDAVPERLRDHPALVAAAHGLHAVLTLYGNEEQGVRTYDGAVEQTPVPAFFHAYWHTLGGLRAGQRNMIRQNAQRTRHGMPPLFSDTDHLAHAVGYGNHDVILGDGRMALNPTGYDELRSMHLGRQLVEALGYTEGNLSGKTGLVIITTRYNEARQSQNINPPAGSVPLQETSAASDLHVFCLPSSPRDTMRVAMEDCFRIGAGLFRPMRRLLTHLNRNRPPGVPRIRVSSMEEALLLMDMHRDFPTGPPEDPTASTLFRDYATRVINSGKFCMRYNIPSHWILGDPRQKTINAERTIMLGEDMLAGRRTALRSYMQTLRWARGVRV